MKNGLESTDVQYLYLPFMKRFTQPDLKQILMYILKIKYLVLQSSLKALRGTFQLPLIVASWS
jgi:hypothetical protein